MKLLQVIKEFEHPRLNLGLIKFLIAWDFPSQTLQHREGFL